MDMSDLMGHVLGLRCHSWRANVLMLLPRLYAHDHNPLVQLQADRSKLMVGDIVSVCGSGFEQGVPLESVEQSARPRDL